MPLLFTFKTMLSNTRFAGQLINPETISDTDQKIAEQIPHFKHDYQEVKNSRKNLRQKVQKLKRALKNVRSKDLASLKAGIDEEKSLLKDIRSYEKALRQQLLDHIKIIAQLKKLIENEDLELLYDLRTPLVSFERFIHSLKEALHGTKIKGPAAPALKKAVEAIEKEYQKLISTTLNLIQEQFRYYNSIGLDFQHFQAQETDYALETHLKNRAKLKLQLNGKVQYILAQIKQLGKKVREFKLSKDLDQEISAAFIKTINYFEQQFQGLVQIALKRVQVADHMIVESLLLQKESYQEIEKIKEEHEAFIGVFLAGQKKKLKFDVTLYSKRKKEFLQYGSKIRAEINQFKKKFPQKIQQVEQDTIEDLKLEEEEVRKVEQQLGGIGYGIKKAVGTLLIMAGLTAALVGPGIVHATSKTFNFGPVNHIAVVQQKVEEKGCAEFVINTFSSGYSLSKNVVTYLGVAGHAWFMYHNLVSRHGKIHYNGFREVYSEHDSEIKQLRKQIDQDYRELKKKHGENEDKIYVQLNNKYAQQIRTFFPQQAGAIDLSKIKVGSIVGMYYNQSASQAKAFHEMKSGTFNTHVGIVTEVREDGTVIVTHNIYGRVNKDPLTTLMTTDNKAHSMVMWVVEPNILKKVATFPITMEQEQAYYGGKITIKSHKITNRTSILFANTYSQNYQRLKYYLKLSAAEMKQLIKISFGILQRESSSGQGIFFSTEKFIDTFFQTYGLDIKTSRSPTQLFLSNFSAEDLAYFGINEATIYQPETAAVATLVLLAKNYTVLKKAGFSGSKLTKATILSWNAGTGRFLESGTIPAYKVNSKKAKFVAGFIPGTKTTFTSEDYYKEVIKVMKQISFSQPKAS